MQRVQIRRQMLKIIGNADKLQTLKKVTKMTKGTKRVKKYQNRI